MNTTKTVNLRVTLPAAGDALGRWMEDHGASVTFQVMIGKYRATVGWRKLHSYSDDTGEHVEEWSVSRSGDTAAEAVTAALDAAMGIAGRGSA
jgi:hypothetical protein